MNVQVRPPKFVQVEMSAEGVIEVPEPIRRAAGLVPGMELVVGINENNEVVLMTRSQERRRGETAAERTARVDAALRAAASGRYSTGQSTAEVMEELRGDRGA